MSFQNPFGRECVVCSWYSVILAYGMDFKEMFQEISPLRSPLSYQLLVVTMLGRGFPREVSRSSHLK